MPRLRLPHDQLLRVLKLIYRHGEVSRAKLGEETGHSAFLISKLCQQLLNAGFVDESSSGTSTGGRRPKLVSIRSGLGTIVGVDVGTVNVRVAVTDIAGHVLAYRKVPNRVASGPDVALPHLISLIEEVLGKAGVKPARLLGIGLGISGVLDRQTGTTLFWPKAPKWVNVPVKEILNRHFKTLVEVEDTPRTMAMAERRLGAAREAREFIYVMLGAGIGAALFLNGQLYIGAGGFAGEFGHTSVNEDGPLCSCGNRGCLETLVSATTLIRAAQEAMARGLSTHLWRLTEGQAEKMSLEIIARAAGEGDRFALNLLHEAGTHIGTGMVGLLNLLNPESIVIGGGLAAATGRFILPAVERVIRERALERTASQLRLELSSLQEVDWARGAALLVAEKALERLFLDQASRKLAPDRPRKSAAREAAAP